MCLLRDGQSSIGGSMDPNNRKAQTAPLSLESAFKLRILLVEDSADTRLLMQAFLNKTPYHVDIAENGEMAVQMFTSGKYALVLMDMQMPVMNGWAATRAIRQWERERPMRPTPIIALSAYADAKDMQESLNAGCTAHLTKPVKKVKLLETISQYAVEKQSRRQKSDEEWKMTRVNSRNDAARGKGIIVHVDAEIQDLVPGFLENRRKDVETLGKALDGGDVETVRILGHTMKGAGGGYGFDAITEIGAHLERAGKGKNVEEVRIWIGKLRDYIDRVEVIYE